jgi:N-ethylmaleimide reductase
MSKPNPAVATASVQLHDFNGEASSREKPVTLPMQLFTPIRVGRHTLPNRLVMSAMTRSRARRDGTPGELAAEYYAQRAGVGLIVAEGTQPSDDGQGYLTTPGIYTPAHSAGWKTVTSAVHDKGGRIFIQLMHAGRMSHPDNTPHHRQAVAPSAIAPGTQMFTQTGMLDIPTPRALTIEEVRQTVADFRLAALSAIGAGADGVEIHGANAYLVQQFFAPSANARTDQYGGSIANRTRFAVEAVTTIAREIGAERTAIRLSPGFTCGESTRVPKARRFIVIWSPNLTSLVLPTCTLSITATNSCSTKSVGCGGAP